jgi:hypothetical protein
MGKIFAVAMMLKKTANSFTEEYLVLHIVTDKETAGDAFLKAFDREKSTTHQGAGCYAKVVLEVEQAPISIPIATEFAEWAMQDGWVCKKNVGWMKHSDETPYVLTTDELWDKYQKEVKP